MLAILVDGKTHGSPIFCAFSCTFHRALHTGPRLLDGLLTGRYIESASHFRVPNTYHLTLVCFIDSTELEKRHSSSRISFWRENFAKPEDPLLLAASSQVL